LIGKFDYVKFKPEMNECETQFTKEDAKSKKDQNPSSPDWEQTNWIFVFTFPEFYSQYI